MARGLRHRLPATKHLDIRTVSLNGITASALSALQTNQAALSVVSNNVSNLNTPGYARRVVNEQTLSADGQLMGVDIASVQRVANQFLQQEALSAGGSASQYDTDGEPVHPAERPSGRARRQPVARHRPHQSAVALSPPLPRRRPPAPARPASSMRCTGWPPTFSNVSSTITSLQSQIDQQVVNSVSSTNS